MKNLDYYAGYLDGEGCFTWNRTSPRVYISNTHLPTLECFQMYFGGTVRKKCDAVGEARELYEWYVYGDSAISLCKEMLPYLREKQTQCAVLLTYRFEKRDTKRRVLRRMLSELKRL